MTQFAAFPSNRPRRLRRDAFTRAHVREHPLAPEDQILPVFLLDGTNHTFNRHDTRTRTMSATPGYSFANSNLEMESMMYRYMFIRDQSYSPNLNNSQRARVINAGTPSEEVEVRETTIDLKKQVMLSWQAASRGTLSDELFVSGIF